MTLPFMLRRALCLFLACALAWLPLASVAGPTCGNDVVQTEADAHSHHHAPAEKAPPDHNHYMHLCHSVCASCVVLSPSFPALQYIAVRQFNNLAAVKVPGLDLPVQERPPRLI